MPRRDHDRRLLGFARRLRAEMTDAERRIWSILRSRKLDGFKFRRQVPIEGYIVDFYCAKANVAVELDGGQHADPEVIKYDQKRNAVLQAAGVHIIRFWDDDVLKHTDSVAEAIHAVCASCATARPATSSSSSPGTPGEAG